MVRHRRQSFRCRNTPTLVGRLARSMRFKQWDVFRAEFDRRRDGVRQHLSPLCSTCCSAKNIEGTLEPDQLGVGVSPEPAEIERVFAPWHFRDPAKAYSLLRRLAYPRNRALCRRHERGTFWRTCFPRLLESLRASADPDQAVLMFTNCVETLGAPAIFYQLLAETSRELPTLRRPLRQ